MSAIFRISLPFLFSWYHARCHWLQRVLRFMFVGLVSFRISSCIDTFSFLGFTVFWLSGFLLVWFSSGEIDLAFSLLLFWSINQCMMFSFNYNSKLVKFPSAADLVFSSTCKCYFMFYLTHFLSTKTSNSDLEVLYFCLTFLWYFNKFHNTLSQYLNSQSKFSPRLSPFILWCMFT